jgi:DNA-directed RNA polymerase specialized sigma24 family protein
MAIPKVAPPDYADLEEAELVRLARAGEREAFRTIMQRGNQRLFRIARGVTRDDAEAEDVVQETVTVTCRKRRMNAETRSSLSISPT